MKKIACFFITFSIIQVASTQIDSIYTPNGTKIFLSIRSELTPSVIAAINQFSDSAYPNAIRLSNASNVYNCHGYSFYMKEGGLDSVWIIAYTPTEYWNDSSYIKTNTPRCYSKVVYPNGGHSAISTTTPDVFISKWGPYALMQHHRDYSPPYDTTGITYYNRNYKISGPNKICITSDTFSIPFLSPDASVEWTATPSSSVIINSPNSPNTTITRVGDGYINLTATIKYACSGNNYPIIRTKKNIPVGNPPYGTPIGADTAWPNGNYYYYVQLPPGHPTPASYFWEVPSGWTILSGQGTNTLYLRTSTNSGVVEVDVTVCGITRPTYKFVEIGMGSEWPDFTDPGEELSRFSIYPNPATSSLNISVKEDEEGLTSKQINEKRFPNFFIREIQITNKTGTILIQQKYSAGNKIVTLDINSLKPDIYLVRIFDGERWHTSKIVVQG